MLKHLIPAVVPTVVSLAGAALLAASSALYAQAPQGDAGKGRPQARFDCSKAKDPKACEARVAKAKTAHEKALKACEGKKDGERRDCMRHEMCSQAADPAKCEARAKEHQAHREKIREACKDKKGDDLKACVREQRGKKS